MAGYHNREVAKKNGNASAFPGHKDYVPKSQQQSLSTPVQDGIELRASSPVAVKAFNPVDRSRPDAYQQFLAREKEVDRAVNILKRGRMRISDDDDARSVAGKAGALTALADAKDPKVGLVTARNSNKDYVGFLSYKSGRSEVSVVNMGTDGSVRGSGRTLVNQVIQIAARENKSIGIASVPSAAGFYRKMGFREVAPLSFVMSSTEAKRRARA